MTAQMIVLVVFAVAIYVLAGYIGLKNPSSGRWIYIDPFYYPIAAIGVVLLFLLNTGQRRQLELIQVQNRTQLEWDALATKKPNVDVSLNSQLLGSASSIISYDQQFADTCVSSPTYTPPCEVAKKLSPAYVNFLKELRDSSSSDVQRVSAYCAAGDSMLKEINSKEEMSPLVSSELMAQYKGMLEKHYSAYNVEAISKEAEDFKGRALSKIAGVESYFAKDANQESVQFVFEEYRKEVDAGVSIILALGPCVTAPHKELDAFLNWSAATVKAEEQVEKVKEEAKSVKGDDSKFSWPRWFNLNLWPYLLVLASSLKFSKAIAQWRKARLDKAAARSKS